MVHNRKNKKIVTNIGSDIDPQLSLTKGANELTNNLYTKNQGEA